VRAANVAMLVSLYRAATTMIIRGTETTDCVEEERRREAILAELVRRGLHFLAGDLHDEAVLRAAMINTMPGDPSAAMPARKLALVRQEIRRRIVLAPQ
jgi:hypothetical protein